MGNIVNIHIDEVQSIASQCTTISTSLSDQAQQLMTQINRLEQAFPSMTVGMHQKFDDWKRLCQQLSDELKSSKGYFDNVVSQADAIISMLKNVQ